MRLRLIAPAVAAACGALALAPTAPAYDTADLRSKLAREMRLAGPSSGLVVRDLDSGQDLYALRPDVARIPASVEKLYTTASALLRLGPATTLDTRAVAAVPVSPDGVLRGELYLVGGGDPFFGARPAAMLARAVHAAGVRRIEGAVVGDETLFDERRSGRGRGYDFDLGGVLSALAYDRGIARGRAQTNAASFAAVRFAALLRAAGVRSTRPSRAGRAPAGAQPVATARSRPVRSLIRFVNVPSNNFASEMLLKALGPRGGASGSTGGGASVARATLDDFGVRPRIADGSGLSRSNRTTPRQVVRLLEHMDGQDVGRTFRASMATAGKTGTVRRRMRGTPASGRCRLKTGTLRNVSALAGYCRTRGGRDLGFAILQNFVSPFGASRVQDRIAASIARLDSRAPAEPPAQPPPATPPSSTPPPAGPPPPGLLPLP